MDIDIDMSNKSAEKTLQKIIRADDESEFISFMKSQCNEPAGRDNNNGHAFSKYQVLKSICSHRARKCLNALYEGDPPLYKHDVPLEGGLFPLHVAAQTLSYSPIVEFLSYGADPNRSCDDDPLNVPLRHALAALCENQFVREWNPSKSTFKLFYIFCLPELKKALATVQLLAVRTKNREAIALRCVLQGNVVHLAALLLLAWDELMEPYAYEGLRNCPIGKLIFSEYQQQENNIALIPNSLDVTHERIANLQAQWNVLQILYRAHRTIEAFRRESYMAKDLLRYEIPFKVAKRLKENHNFYFRSEDLFWDDMTCFAPHASLKPQEKAWLNRALNKKVSAFSAPSTLIETNAAGTISSSRSFHTFLVRSSYYAEPTRSHQLGTCQARNSNYVEPARTQLSKTTHASMRFLHKFLQSQDMAPLVNLLKRSVRKL